MSFDKVLEYQNVDAQLAELSKNFNSKEIVIKYKQDMMFIQKAAAQITKCKQTAQALAEQYAKIVAEIKELQTDVDEFKSLEAVDDIAEIDEYIKELNQTLTKIQSLERECSALKNDMKLTVEENNTVFKAGVQKNMELKNIKDAYNKANVEFMQNKQLIEGKLAELKKAVPPIFMEKYELLKKDGKLPAFIEYKPDEQKGDPVCPRCRMALNYDVKSRLKNSGDFYECPNCHRVLIVPQGR